MNKLEREVRIEDVEMRADFFENARNVEAVFESLYEDCMDMIAADADGWEDAVIFLAEMGGW